MVRCGAGGARVGDPQHAEGKLVTRDSRMYLEIWLGLGLGLGLGVGVGVGVGLVETVVDDVHLQRCELGALARRSFNSRCRRPLTKTGKD